MAAANSNQTDPFFSPTWSGQSDITAMQGWGPFTNPVTPMQQAGADIYRSTSLFPQQEKLQGQQIQGRLAESQIAADAAKYPAQLKQQRFNTVWGALSPELQGFASQNPYTIGGSSGTGPTINANPIWNPAQIQGQVNAQRAQTDQQTATNVRNSGNKLAGQGFGANSPLAQALAGQYQGQGMAQNASNEQATRFNTAQGNAQQVFAGQQAQEAQYASRQQEAIARAQPYFQHQNALLAALAGLAG